MADSFVTTFIWYAPALGSRDRYLWNISDRSGTKPYGEFGLFFKAATMPASAYHDDSYCIPQLLRALSTAG